MRRPQKTRVLVLEPHVSGHHGPYLNWMATALVESEFAVTIVTLPGCMQHPCIRALSNSLTPGDKKAIQVIPAPDRHVQRKERRWALGLAARELAYWRLFRRWYSMSAESVRPDVVFLPYLDYCLYAIGLLGSPFKKSPWVGLAMRPSFHYEVMGVVARQPSLAGIKRALFFRLLSNRFLRCLLTTDEPLAEYVHRKAPRLRKTLFLSEPAELADLPAAADAKQQLGVPPERELILLYGAISRRKGIPELLQALAHPTFPPSVDILLAGRVSDDIRGLLAEGSARSLLAQGRIRLLDRYITTEEEPVIFAAADIVWLGYRGHYTCSGVLVQAANARRPVLACEEGIIGWQTKRHGLGEVVEPADVPAVIHAVRSLLDNAGRVSGRTTSEAKPALGSSFQRARRVLAQAIACGAAATDDMAALYDLRDQYR